MPATNQPAIGFLMPMGKKLWSRQVASAQFQAGKHPGELNIIMGDHRWRPTCVDVEMSGHGHLRLFKQLLEHGWPGRTVLSVEVLAQLRRQNRPER